MTSLPLAMTSSVVKNKSKNFFFLKLGSCQRCSSLAHHCATKRFTFRPVSLTLTSCEGDLRVGMAAKLTRPSEVFACLRKPWNNPKHSAQTLEQSPPQNAQTLRQSHTKYPNFETIPHTMPSVPAAFLGNSHLNGWCSTLCHNFHVGVLLGYITDMLQTLHGDNLSWVWNFGTIFNHLGQITGSSSGP